MKTIDVWPVSTDSGFQSANAWPNYVEESFEHLLNTVVSVARDGAGLKVALVPQLSTATDRR